MKGCCYQLFMLSLVSLLSVHSLVDADEKAFQQASFLLDAEQNAAAAERYRALAQAAQTPWEEMVAQLNWGRALLGPSDKVAIAQALSHLLVKYRTLPPLLRRELSALLVRMWMVEIEQALHKPYKAEDLEYAYGLLQKSLKSIQETEAAACDLQLAKGALQCTANVRLVQLRAWLDILLVRVCDAMRVEFLAPQQLSEGLWRLQAVVLAAKDNLEVLHKMHTDQALFNSYSLVYLQGIEQWQALLVAVIKLVHMHDEHFPVDALGQSYSALTAAMQEGDLEAASIAAEKLLTAVDQLNRTVQAGMSGKQIFEILIARHVRVLRSDPVQKIALEILLQAERSSEGVVLPQAFIAALKHAEALTQKAYEALTQDEPRVSRLFIEESKHVLEVALQIQKEGESRAAYVLRKLIVEQQYAHHLVTLLLVPLSPLKAEELAILAQTQHVVQALVSAFLAASLEQQQQEFQGSDGKPGRCQKRPWDTVLPLFHKGSTAAAAANDMLKSKQVSLNAANEWQQQALQAWQQALDTLVQPLAPGKDSCYDQGGSSGGQGDDKQPAPSKPSDALSKVQQMQQDDHLEKQNQVKRKLLKPW